MLTTYKYGWKTSYYQNTMDGKTEDVVKDAEPVQLQLDPFTDNESDCDACAI